MNRSKLMIVTSLLALLSTVYSCQQPCILLSNNTNILAVSVSRKLTENQHPTSVISNLKRSVVIDVHVSKRLLFWSDTIEKNIKRANLDGRGITTIVQKTTGIISGLAVEWNANLLYWTETGTNHTIKVARLNGSRKKVLIGDYLVDPRGIALDPQAGLMFWISRAKIECAYLNGEKRRTIITIHTSSSQPRDIALDYSSRKMYWSDDWNNKIAYADYNGSNHKYLEPSRGIHHFGVDIYSSWLYSTSSGAQLKLNQMDKTSGSLIGKTQTHGRVGHLVVMDSSRQPSC